MQAMEPDGQGLGGFFVSLLIEKYENNPMNRCSLNDQEVCEIHFSTCRTRCKNGTCLDLPGWWLLSGTLSSVR